VKEQLQSFPQFPLKYLTLAKQKLLQSESTSQSAPHISEHWFVQTPEAQVKGLQLTALTSLQKCVHPFRPSHRYCFWLAVQKLVQAYPETEQTESELQVPSTQAVSSGQ